MMGRKIQGYIDWPVIDPADPQTQLIASVVAAPFADTESVRCVTLIEHDGDKHERVFTESEIKAILHDMRSWISPDDGEEGRMWETRAKSHGIVLDPA